MFFLKSLLTLNFLHCNNSKLSTTLNIQLQTSNIASMSAWDLPRIQASSAVDIKTLARSDV